MAIIDIPPVPQAVKDTQQKVRLALACIANLARTDFTQSQIELMEQIAGKYKPWEGVFSDLEDALQTLRDVVARLDELGLTLPQFEVPQVMIDSINREIEETSFAPNIFVAARPKATTIEVTFSAPEPKGV